jgi:cell division protein FtsQ
MNLDTVRKIAKLALRLGGIALVGGGVFALGLLGWQWQANAPVHHVAVNGATYAHPDTLRALARVDTGATMDDVEPLLIADRVSRHPWVEHVGVRLRHASQTLALVVTERRPSALVIREQVPVFYLDATGHAMPLPDSIAFDVPLLHGLKAEYHPLKPVAPSALVSLLQTLNGHSSQPWITDIDVVSDTEVRVHTRPEDGIPSVVADLGDRQFASRLDRLAAFRHQVLRTQAPPNAGYVDLRFNGQIVARDAPG